MNIRITLALALILLAGCSSLGGAVPGRVESQTFDPAIEPVAALDFLDRLARASAAELQSMPARQPAGPDEPHAALRHGLWLATPGHPGHDADAARERLEALLEDGRRLDAPTRALLRIQLRHLQARREWLDNNQRLATENDRLREQIQALTTLERRMNGEADASGDSSP